MTKQFVENETQRFFREMIDTSFQIHDHLSVVSPDMRNWLGLGERKSLQIQKKVVRLLVLNYFSEKSVLGSDKFFANLYESWFSEENDIGFLPDVVHYFFQFEHLQNHFAQHLTESTVGIHIDVLLSDLFSMHHSFRLDEKQMKDLAKQILAGLINAAVEVIYCLVFRATGYNTGGDISSNLLERTLVQLAEELRNTQ